MKIRAAPQMIPRVSSGPGGVVQPPSKGKVLGTIAIGVDEHVWKPGDPFPKARWFEVTGTEVRSPYTGSHTTALAW